MCACARFKFKLLTQRETVPSTIPSLPSSSPYIESWYVRLNKNACVGCNALMDIIWKCGPCQDKGAFLYYRYRYFTRGIDALYRHCIDISMNRYTPIRKQAEVIVPKRACTHTHTHQKKTSVPAFLTWQQQLVLYQNKIQWTKHHRTHLCITDWSTKPIIHISKNYLAFRYVTSQIWNYVILGFVMNERGRMHEHKAQLSAQVFKVYSIFLCQSMWETHSESAHGHSLVGFVF